jgi:hypothetical protein
MKQEICLKTEVFKAVKMSIVFCIVTSRSVISGYQYLGKTVVSIFRFEDRDTMLFLNDDICLQVHTSLEH